MENSQVPAADFCIGAVVGFRGLKGEMKVRLETNRPQILSHIKTIVAVKPNGEKVEATVKKVQMAGNILVLLLDEYDDRNKAEALFNCRIFADRKELNALGKDEWWVRDLIGLSAFSINGGEIGTICGVIDQEPPLLEIAPLGEKTPKTILVPFVKALVPEVDMTARKLKIADIPGLLEPQ